MKRPKRAAVSDYTSSILRDEVTGRCPLCGAFEDPAKTRGLTHHHINRDSSVSEYWNLIRLCRTCHDELEKRNDRHMDRKVLEIKRALFRGLVGPAAFEVLLLGNQLGVTSTLPCLAQTILKLGLVEVAHANPFTVGTAKHPTVQDFRITAAGKELIERLRLR